MATTMQQAWRARPSTADWPSRVQRLWGFRRHHWDSVRKRRFNGSPLSSASAAAAAAAASPRCLTARSAPELRSLSAHRFRSSKPRPPCSLSMSARSHSKSTSSFYNPSDVTNSCGWLPREQHCEPSTTFNLTVDVLIYNLMAAWKESLVPVPVGLATQTQSQLLVGLVSRGSEAFLEQRHCPPRSYTNFELLKLGPRLSGFGSKLLPASQAALEQSLKKEQCKHRAPVNTGNVAFGRSNYASYLTRNNDRSPRRSVGQFPNIFSGATSARRDVIHTIQEYHINSQARAQLT